MAYSDICFLLAIAVSSAASDVVLKDPICLDGPFHKPKPSPEGPEYAACHAFNSSSCCTADFTKQLSTSPIKAIGNFSWETCGQLSKRCEDYMKEIECFYQCSPLVGYWKGTFKASFNDVPLCSNVCDSWFDACKSDLTCAKNWIMDFNISNVDGSNSCKGPCRNFTEVYGDGKGLCEGMWGQSFKYKVSTEEHDCMTLNFSLPVTDINLEVVKKTFGVDGCVSTTSNILIVVMAFVLTYLIGEY